MTNYTMPVLSEQEREEQVEWLAEEARTLERHINRLESYGETFDASPHKKALVRAQIALAALTAEPVGHGFREDIHLMKSRRMVNGSMTVRYHGEEALFTAPPVPVKQEGE